MTSAAELRAAVEAVGGRVVETKGDRFGYPVLSVRVADNTHAIELLNELAARDAHDPRVQEMAYLVRGSARDPLGSAQSIQAFVQAAVPFIPESVETFQHPLYTLRYGGDCDDHARLVVALNLALGTPAACEPTFSPYDDLIRHVAPRVQIGTLRWSETTCAAFWDEHPRQAGIRLGLVRPDVMGVT